MIKQVLHEATAPFGPAGVSLALAVAYEMHAPAPAVPEAYELDTAMADAPVEYALHTTVTRAPEVSVPQLMGLRTTAARPHRRKVPLNRLTAVMG